MNRSEARAAAVTALELTGSYTQVYSGPPDSFDGQSPVAVVLSRGTTVVEEARDLVSLPGEIGVAIYVRREPGAEAAAEDLLDALSEAALLTLLAVGLRPRDTDAGGVAAALRLIDGSVYRVETIIVVVDYED